MKKFMLTLTAVCLVMALALTGTLSMMADEVLYGDVDGNGKINNKDLALLQQYVNDWEVTIDEVASDVDGNGKINNKDLALLQQFVNDWEVTLGPVAPDPDVPGDDNIYNDTELDWT